VHTDNKRNCIIRRFLRYAHSQNPHLRPVNCGFSSFASLENPLLIAISRVTYKRKGCLLGQPFFLCECVAREFIFVGSGGGALRHTHEDTAAGRLNLSREIIFGGRGGSEFHSKIRALRPLCISFAEKDTPRQSEA
ncbi:MAG: hypothetical protein IKU22_04885, partial [Alistipes sp.]|nr:hypothetical protein [Alistipes sp.]